MSPGHASLWRNNPQNRADVNSIVVNFRSNVERGNVARNIVALKKMSHINHTLSNTLNRGGQGWALILRLTFTKDRSYTSFIERCLIEFRQKNHPTPLSLSKVTVWLDAAMFLPKRGSHNIRVQISFLILDCEAIGTAATPGLLCQPRVIVKMIVEK
jgi:hypothetical protein